MEASALSWVFEISVRAADSSFRIRGYARQKPIGYVLVAQCRRQHGLMADLNVSTFAHSTQGRLMGFLEENYRRRPFTASVGLTDNAQLRYLPVWDRFVSQYAKGSVPFVQPNRQECVYSRPGVYLLHGHQSPSAQIGNP
jgi:hypothetical protein